MTIIYDENVSPSETDCSVIKVSHIASFTSAHDKFLMENNSKTVKGGGGGGGGKGVGVVVRPYKLEDQYFFLDVLRKVDQSRHGENSHFKMYHSNHPR